MRYLSVSDRKFRMYIDFGATSTKENSTTLTLTDGNDGLKSMNYFSGEGITYTIGEYDNFKVGYKVTIDCSN